MPSKRRRRAKGKGKTVSENEHQQQLQVTSEAHASSTQVSSQTQDSVLDIEDESASIHEDTQIVASEDDLHFTPDASGNNLEQFLTLGTPLAKRPDYGTRWRKINLIVNYFPVELPRGDVYHYDIMITLKRRDSQESALSAVESKKKEFRCLNTRTNREVLNEMLRQHSDFHGYIPAYDGKRNLFTKTPLKGTSLKVPLKVQLPTNDNAERSADDPAPRGDVFEVSIKPVTKKETHDNVISLDSVHALYQRAVNHVPLEAVMALETILRNGPCFQHVPLGRSFFPWPHQGSADIHSLSGGKEIWFGYHKSLILTEWKPVVNIDITATTFFKNQALIAYVCEILNCKEEHLLQVHFLRDCDIALLSKKLKGVKVKVSHLSYDRQYRIIRFTRETAGKLKFPMETSEGPKDKKVSDYFLEKYNKKLRFPNLPCVQVQPEQKEIYLPLEVCNIVAGQHARGQLSKDQTSKMVKVVSLPPKKRFEKIQEVLRQAQFNSDPCNREFGIRVSSKPLITEGRVIQPPSIRYYDDKLVRPKNGSWKTRPEKFFRGADINSWVLLSFANEIECNVNDLNSFVSLLINIGGDHGLSLENPECVRIFPNGRTHVGSILESITTEFKNVQLAVVVLQDKSSSFYSTIKQASETVLGLTTQCVLPSNVSTPDLTVVSNICLKLNAKMGGINCSLTPGETPAIFNKPIIIIGADVTHPVPGSGCRPSIAAVVASLDRHPFRYAVSMRTQRHVKIKRQAAEIIQDLEQMIVDLLKIFYRETNQKKPEKIIFYRDGVSESQLIEVRDYELRALRKACMRMGPDYRPGITFIVVQKRHHTRFMPEDPGQGVGPKKNVPPGTVVDKGISSIINFDFFLCSHFGLQGTSRSGHYTVISDDNNFTSDQLQQLTYYLCHIYARCTKSISLPAPVKYAHLAAYRASKYLEAELGESSASSDNVSPTEFKELLSKWKDIISVQPEMKNKMFFL